MSEPVEYQMRMRPTWEVTSWSDWKKCSRDSFDDYIKTPKLHDWEYEVRELYTTPPQRPWVGLTYEEVQEIHDTYHKRMGPQEFASMIESKLRSKNEHL